MTFWEEVAQTRWGAYMSEVERRVILQGERLAGAPGQALEVGCEGGRWSRMLAARGWQMTCTDVDARALEACQRSIPDARCILANPADCSIDCETGAFSLLLCIEVPPVIHSDWFLGEAHRLLGEGGILVAVTWNSVSLRAVLARAQFGERRKGRSYVYKTTYRDWRRRLSGTGFRMEAEEGFCWAPFGRASNSRWVPLFTRLERLFGLNRIVAASPWIVFVARKVSSHADVKSAGPRSTPVTAEKPKIPWK